MALQLLDYSGLKVGFIGAGNMAQAIGIGLVKDRVLLAANVTVSAPSARNFAPWKALGIATTHLNTEVVMKSHLIFLAMKPQFLEEALCDIEKDVVRKLDTVKLFVSVLAGKSLDTLYKKLKEVVPKCSVVRAMPNTALTVAAGVVAIASSEAYANSDDVCLVQNLLSKRSMCIRVPEKMITPIGAIAGSGIAYAYLMIEAMSDGGVKMGIPREQSTMLAAQAVLGASKMVLESRKHPAVLKDDVCSAGGTTIEGIHQLESGSFRGTIMSAVEAAARKSEELEME